MKHLKRRIFIRQYDFHRIQSRAQQVYDSVSFEPVTLKEIKHEHLFRVLNGAKLPEPMYGEYHYPRNYLYAMQNYLYDKRYVEWFSKYDEDGYMWIQSRRDAPESMLGWATFEYDY